MKSYLIKDTTREEREKLAVARDKLAKLNARIEDLANM